MVANLKNDTHVIEIVTRSGNTLGSNILNLDEDPNEKRVEEHVRRKNNLIR